MADHRQLHSTDALLIQGGFAVVATELIPYLEQIRQQGGEHMGASDEALVPCWEFSCSVFE